jgi:hypothetical protein
MFDQIVDPQLTLLLYKCLKPYFIKNNSLRQLSKQVFAKKVGLIQLNNLVLSTVDQTLSAL